MYRWYPKQDSRPMDPIHFEKRTDTPAASINTGPPKTYRRPRASDAHVGEKEEKELLDRLAQIEQERNELLASIAENNKRKDTVHKYRGSCNVFLDTYRAPETARTNLIPGETYGKIYSH